MSASPSDDVTYPDPRVRRSPSIKRVVRAVGLEPFFLAALAVTVTVGVVVGLLVATFTEPAHASAVPPTAEWVENGPPAWESTWLMPIKLTHGRPIGGIQRLEVDQGDEVAIGVDLDTAATISIERYGLWTYVHPYQKGLLELIAWDWGQFRVRADGHLIGVLTVRPDWAGPAR
jgi:hypothetical protein